MASRSNTDFHSSHSGSTKRTWTQDDILLGQPEEPQAEKPPIEAKAASTPVRGPSLHAQASRLSLASDDAYHEADRSGAPLWPRQVGVGIKVENILSVDNVTGSFTAVFKVSYEWKLTRQEHEEWLRDQWKSQKGRPPWEPSVELPTALRIEKRDELVVPGKQTQIFDVFEHLGEFATVVYVRYRAVFSEPYELENFPFDCQDLAIILQARDPDREVLAPRFKRDEFASLDLENCCLPEWEFHPPVVTISKGLAAKGRSGRPGSSRFTFQVKMRRRHEFYVKRIVVTSALLTFGAILSYSIDWHQPHRLMVCFTLLLTLIAFQTAVAGKLPQVRYFTLLDWYLVMSQRFIVAVALAHAVVCKWIREPNVDNACFYCVCIAWALMQVCSIQTFRQRRTREVEKLTLNVWQLKAWLAKHQVASAPVSYLWKMRSVSRHHHKEGLHEYDIFTV